MNSEVSSIAAVIDKIWDHKSHEETKNRFAVCYFDFRFLQKVLGTPFASQSDFLRWHRGQRSFGWGDTHQYQLLGQNQHNLKNIIFCTVVVPSRTELFYHPVRNFLTGQERTTGKIRTRATFPRTWPWSPWWRKTERKHQGCTCSMDTSCIFHPFGTGSHFYELTLV